MGASKKCDNISIHLRHNSGIGQSEDIILALDSQMDGRICHNSVVLCMHCTVTCNKNWVLNCQITLTVLCCHNIYCTILTAILPMS